MGLITFYLTVGTGMFFVGMVYLGIHYLESKFLDTTYTYPDGVLFDFTKLEKPKNILRFFIRTVLAWPLLAADVVHMVFTKED